MGWGDFFSCCLKSRSESPDPTAQPVRDEHTVLLPPPSQENYNSTSVLDQRLKDRLGAITTLKKGKMVNVKRSTPFNIRNDPSLLSDRDRDHEYYSDRDRDPRDDGDYTNGHNDTSRSISRVSSDRSLSSSQISRRERSERRPILNMRLANTQALGVGPMEGEYIERGRSRERGRRGSNIDPNVKFPGQNGLPPPIAAGHRIRIEDVGEISQSWRD